MDPEQKERFRERIRNMSPEERKALRQKIRERKLERIRERE